MQIESVYNDLQNRESEITAMRKKSFMQIGGLMGFVLLLSVVGSESVQRFGNYDRKSFSS